MAPPRVLLNVAAHTLRASVPMVLDGLLGRIERGAVDRRIDAWSRGLLDALGVRVRVRGAEHLRGWRPAVVMSNHQSHYDIPVLFQVIPAPLRMVAKAELQRIPVWGEAMRVAGIVFIDRGDRARAIANLQRAKEQLARGVSVWIAPEGTRSPDGALGAFKKGGFVLAREVGAAIVPVTVSGTRDVLPPRSLATRAGVEVTVTIHPRVDPRAFATRDALMEAMRAAIASALPAQGAAENGRPPG